MVKRIIQDDANGQELKRRTIKVRFFPGEDTLSRLVSAVLVETDEN